tara:strand:- start:1706 stop:1819 length:114 start_codon:yes stop_codon:yes gene_type:complete
LVFNRNNKVELALNRRKGFCKKIKELKLGIVSEMFTK